MKDADKEPLTIDDALEWADDYGDDHDQWAAKMLAAEVRRVRGAPGGLRRNARRAAAAARRERGVARGETRAASTRLPLPGVHAMTGIIKPAATHEADLTESIAASATALEAALRRAEKTLRATRYGSATVTVPLPSGESLAFGKHNGRWALHIAASPPRQRDLFCESLELRLAAARAIPALVAKAQRAAGDRVAEIDAAAAELSAYLETAPAAAAKGGAA
jgi:hypothetical protein